MSENKNIPLTEEETKDKKNTKKGASESKTKGKKDTKSNLIPFDQLTEEEQRAIRKKGTEKSIQVRKAKKEAKEALKKAPQDVMEWLYNLTPDQTVRKAISEKLGVPVDEISSVERVAVVSMYNQVRKGNVKAFEALEKKNSNKAELKSRADDLKLKEKELKMKQEKHDADMEDYRKRMEEASKIVYHGIPALSVAPTFLSSLFDIDDHAHTEYVFPGGRGSGKSSFISETIIDLLEKHSELNALVMRNVSNTLKDSVYNQLKWAINELGLTNEYKCTANPAKITKLSTGQQIFFRGADDPGKIKSIKPEKGYLGILWFEELDQYAGPETVRNIEQSAMRGGDNVWVFKSFNPPKSAINWANKYVLIPKENQLIVKSDYRTVPQKWLGKNWIEEAELLKQINPSAYENEYLGVANGTGGKVFNNVTVREISMEERAQFDHIYEGVDWGWFPDPFHFSRMHYDSNRMKLYIYGEYRANKQSNEDNAKAVREKFDKTCSYDGGKFDECVDDAVVYCDSAEPKSTADWKVFGMPARNVTKGPDSVRYSMKWLQSLSEIIIDPNECPNTATEFNDYEYERDRDGNVISGYPDKNNHAIDSVRYAMFPVWKRRGQ